MIEHVNSVASYPGSLGVEEPKAWYEASDQCEVDMSWVQVPLEGAHSIPCEGVFPCVTDNRSCSCKRLMLSCGDQVLKYCQLE